MLQHTMFALALVIALPQDPPKPKPEASTPKTAEEPPKLEYPTFEPFVGSRMFKLLAGDLEQVDLAEIAKEVGKLDEINETAAKAGEKVAGVDKSKRPSAELSPKLPGKEKPLYWVVPIVLMKLEPLWELKSWSEEQVALATQGAQIIGKLTGSPALAFKSGEGAHNHSDLEKLVRWFHATAAKPECFAAMIFTMDDGPYAGLPHETTVVLPAVESVTLDEHMQLNLAKVERATEPWVFQCVRDGKLQWTRVVSGEPDGQVESATFAEVEPNKTGPYGWHVYFQVDWDFGVEQAHLYVNAKGELICYFLSW